MGEARDQTGDETSQREGSVNGNLDKPDSADSEAKIALGAFHLIERFLLIVVALMTLGGVASEIWSIYLAQAITLADILLMFLYTEVMGMVAVFYTGHSSIFVYPIFIRHYSTCPADCPAGQGHGAGEYPVRGRRDPPSLYCSGIHRTAQAVLIPPKRDKASKGTRRR